MYQFLDGFALIFAFSSSGTGRDRCLAIAVATISSWSSGGGTRSQALCAHTSWSSVKNLFLKKGKKKSWRRSVEQDYRPRTLNQTVLWASIQAPFLREPKWMLWPQGLEHQLSLARSSPWKVGIKMIGVVSSVIPSFRLLIPQCSANLSST